MKFRCLAMIGLGAVMALAVPMHAFAERTVDRTQKTSSVNVEKPKAKTKSVARNKKKPDAKAEPAKAESDNVFANFFKPADKAKPAKAVDKPKVKQSAKAAKEQPKPVAPQPAIVASGNNGELRSEAQPNRDLFSALFGGPQAGLLPETRALDAALDAKEARRKFQVKSEFEPQEVSYGGYKPGTIVIDTAERRLYLIESSTKARRYAIAVGRDGLQFKGKVRVGDKQEWPRWIPTLDMQKREPKHYGQYKDGMPGGPDNPLGARAIYLYQGKSDTHLRIHGTNQPQTIGTSASNGCFRMINDHVKDLYRRVKVGTEVVVL